MGVKISVVVASLNCEKVIEQFLCSFISQDYHNKELIVVDGGSTDSTLEIIKKYRADVSTVISEKDKGIYDAYNKGVRKATGDYVVFFGADDLFYDKCTLSNVAGLISGKSHPDLLCTTVYYIDKGWAYIEKKRILYRWNEGLERKQPMVPHQGLYTKKEVLQEHPFSTDYRISSDLDFYLYCNRTKKHIAYADVITAYFSRQGISSINEKKRKSEENDILVHYGEKKTEDHGYSEIRRRIRQQICLHRWGIILMIRFRGFRIHKCRNKKCIWCDHNRNVLKKRSVGSMRA